METQSSFIWSDCAVHLYSITSVDLDFSFVVEPWYPENNHALRLCNTFKHFEVYEIRMLHDIRCNAFKDFFYGLMKFILSRVSRDEVCHKGISILLCIQFHSMKINLLSY